MQIQTDEDGSKRVYLNSNEFEAFEIIQLGKEMEGESSQGLGGDKIFKELKRKKLTGSEIRAGQQAYNIWKQGGSVSKGSGARLPDYMYI